MPPPPILRFDLISLLSVRHGSEQRLSVPQYNCDHHLVHTLRGQGWLQLGGKMYEATPGSVIALPPFTLGTFTKIAGIPWEMLNIHYSLTLSSGHPIDACYNLPVIFYPEEFRRIKASLINAFQLSQADPAYTLRWGAVVLPLIAKYWMVFSKTVPHSPSEDHSMTVLAKRIENLGKDFDASALAAATHLSVSQMNRRFRKSRGLSPKAYWLGLRLAKAEEYLRGTNYKISTIADELGFADPYFFTKWFARKIGMPPGEYRKRCKVNPF